MFWYATNQIIFWGFPSMVYTFYLIGKIHFHKIQKKRKTKGDSAPLTDQVEGKQSSPEAVTSHGVIEHRAVRV